jgi:glucuronate isomerase
MCEFLGSGYLLSSQAAQEIFSQIEALPIIDPHNHADVREIRQNDCYTDLWQVEASTDHYVWETLRKCGLPENLITGAASPKEKWIAAAGAFDRLIGNPTYEWIHLDLKRILGIDQRISADSAEAIWESTVKTLATDAMRPQALLKRMKVEVMCSTDDPIDMLDDHRDLAEAGGYTRVRPTFRPDKAMNVHKPDWREYIDKLQARVGKTFESIGDLIEALRVTHDYFAENGCLASDHGVEVPYAYQVSEDAANAAFKSALSGNSLDKSEQIDFSSYVLNEVAEMDCEKGWVFQVHMGVVRDVRDSLFESLGYDTGGDVSNHTVPILEPLTPLLNRFDGRLKVVLYCIDPNHQQTLATLTRAFGSTVVLGSAWWLNDSPYGMKSQMEYIAGVDLLSCMAGMVSDSRKLMSYASRHEMFRRCLADVLGKFVSEGRAPMDVAVEQAKQISYYRVKEFWGL